ncbi:MAG: hypothetical protein B6244_07120 [Candidatus Cloacimonetes bacterium 4572_55]|nr:MAG: hypothetical protein B6244_07120 [Candidatus Cloacimonetes bacterium 4572_55]
MKKAFTILLVLVVFLAFTIPVAYADSIYGTCKHKDGSKVDGTVRVSTSWNNKKVYPRNGKYKLDFGKNVDAKITVYVNGKKYTTISVDGDEKLDILIK